MPKQATLNVKFESNGELVMGKLSVAAKDLQAAVASSVGHLNKSMRRAYSSLGASTMALKGLATAMTDLIAPSVQFDEAMRTANTMAQKGAEDFEKLKDQVKRLADVVPVARDQLANGLYQVISNGVPENNWISFLEQSAKSSIGGVANLEEVVKVTSTVIKNYGMQWEAVGEIQDKIQLTAKNGVTSFELLAQALPKVTGNAATLGVQIDELLATYSTLTGVSGNTAEVSTQLGAIFTSLIKPTSEATRMAKEMGIEFNAASIKAAGGLGNFLTNLDAAVKQYATANGMIEQTIYGKLFGSAEALRAIGPLVGQLSDKYQENVAAMADSAGAMEKAFRVKSEGVAASIQRMKNMLANWTDYISNTVATYHPYIQVLAQLGMSYNGLKTIMTGFKTPLIAIDLLIRKSTIGAKAHNAVFKTSSAIFYKLPKSLSGAIASVVGLGKVSRGAAMAVRGLAVAIKTVMSATVIGLIFVAVTSIIDAFTNSVDDASDALDESKKEFEDWKKSLTDISQATGEIAAKEITALDALYKAATDETKSRRERVRAANELKNTYKDAFGNLKTEAILAGQAAKAYDNLKESIIASAKAEAAGELIKENRKKSYSLEVKKDDLIDEASAKGVALLFARQKADIANMAYQDEINKRRNSEEDDRWGLKELVALKEAAHEADMEVERLSNEYELINKKISGTVIQINELDKAKDKLEKHIVSPISADNNTRYNNLSDTLIDSDKTYKQQLEAKLATAKDRYVKASIAGNDAEAASIKLVIDSLREQLAQIDLVEKKAERPAILTTLEDINAEIQYQQMLRSKASKENIAAIDAEIERLVKERIAMEYAQEPNIDKIKTYQDLEKAQQYYQQKMQYASEAERIEIQKIINQLEELKEKWDESLAGLKAPGDLASLDTLEKLSTALSYYQAQLEKASPDEIPGLVKMMEGIKEAQVLAQRPVTIATARYETDSISGLDKKTKKQKIRAIGYDELTDKIAALQAMLDDTEHPLLESQRNEVKELIEIYSQWQKSSVDTWGAVTQGISASASMLSNLGGAVKGAAAEWLSSIGQIMESLAKLIPLLLTVTGIKAMESAAETPIVGWMLVGAAAAAVIAAVASLPKFADGGIAYGPTLGMFGEYAGASNNPEVVAPLSKLRTLIEPAGFDAGKVEFEIDGTKLKGVLKRVEKRSSRS